MVSRLEEVKLHWLNSTADLLQNHCNFWSPFGRLLYNPFPREPSRFIPSRPRRHTEACTDSVRLLSGSLFGLFHPSFIKLSSNTRVDFHPHFTPVLPSSVCRFPPQFCPSFTPARFKGLISVFEAIDIVIFMVIHRGLQGLNNSFYF